MTESCDLHTAHRLLDDVCEGASDWLLQASGFLRAGAVLAGLTGSLDFLGLLPRGYDTDHQIDVVLLVAAPLLFVWGSRWARAARPRACRPCDTDGA